MESHYEVLGVPPDADRDTVKAAYRALLKDHHPDHGGSRERFLRIKEAYERIVGEKAPTAIDTGHYGATGGNGTRAHVADPTYNPSVEPSDRTYDLTVAGDFLTVSLVALAHGRHLSSLVDGELNAATKRTIAFFTVENTSDQTIAFDGRSHTSFIGDDGFLYEGSNIVAPHANELPGRWWPSTVVLTPGRAVDAMVVCQELPDGVTIDRVVYTQHVSEHDFGDDERTESDVATETERYLFEIKAGVRHRLDRFPVDFS